MHTAELLILLNSALVFLCMTSHNTLDTTKLLVYTAVFINTDKLPLTNVVTGFVSEPISAMRGDDLAKICRLQRLHWSGDLSVRQMRKINTLCSSLVRTATDSALVRVWSAVLANVSFQLLR